MVLHLVLFISFCLRLVQVIEGNIDDFDCIDIYKQPAFQHPLLKHHKIQETFNSGESLDRNYNYKINGQRCPKGTVPILRQRNRTESVHLDTIDYPGQHFAVVETLTDPSIIYRGAQADISIHNVTVKINQYSKGQIWLENGSRSELNSIQAGWAVIVWRQFCAIYYILDHGYTKTGCYNTICPGFIIVTQDPSIGNIFGKSSTETTFFTPQIFQDDTTGNWVLKVFDDIIGYWPRELFTHLNKGASLVRFGGNTYVSTDGISPPMGNGQFPVPDFQKSSNFMHVKVMNSKNGMIDIEEKTIKIYADAQCFKITYWGYNKENGVAFSYGGPGGNCGI